MKKVTILLFALVAVLSTVFSVSAQDSIKPGETVEGEITDDTYAVAYEYIGTAGEVIVVDLFPVDVLADYDNPSVIIELDGVEILRYDGYGATTVVTQLPDDGTYTITAGRRDDADGDSVGEYTLTLRNPTPITIDEPQSNTIDNESTHYYVYDGDEDFMVSFARQGDYAPQISVNTVDTSATPGRLDAVAAMGGPAVTRGTMGVIPGGELYVLVVEEPLFSFSFGEITAEYALGLFLPEE
ncbi:hypothetical protein G4Y79_12645 [Phototrophicus methaneseepsis]|uniref:Peptidase C-terminal archaeal/bacterial domain-containing protein n=1 Tax=Phototrophicus methaneseepsis TaxID=2710758 RepID=A0A7S8E564_9CHLR|nr:hypothetical protein [Phototrophicus methaneseepsis]QPC80561.1 hypothetical protein G4Y79_12645 [Phototrophicus methaneseepsis]